METYQQMLICDLRDENVQNFKDVHIEMNLTFNENGVPVRSGQGHALIGIVGGENKIRTLCFGISEEIREIFLKQKVNIFFINPGLQVKILNASVQQKGSNLIIEGGEIIKVASPQLI